MNSLSHRNIIGKKHCIVPWIEIILKYYECEFYLKKIQHRIKVKNMQKKSSMELKVYISSILSRLRGIFRFVRE